MRNGKARVLLVAPTFGAFGGMEAFVLRVARELRGDARFEVRVCFKRTRTFALQPDLADAIATPDVELCDRASSTLYRAIAWADLVHGQNASLDVVLLAAALRRPVVLSIHNVLAGTPRWRRWSWQAAARLVHRRWYNSEHVWRTWESSPRSNSARVCPVDPLSPGRVPIAERRGFLFIGRLVEGKGVLTLLEAYRRSGVDTARWPLTILGDGPMRSTIDRRLATHEYPGVSRVGFQSGAAKRELIAAAEWVVVPSQWDEPFGMVAAEARSVAVPVIATRDGGLPEAAGRDALMCAPGDADALAATLRQAAAMSHEEYASRAERTQRDLQVDLAPRDFYQDAYLDVIDGNSMRLITA